MRRAAQPAFVVDTDGIVSGVRFLPSPNCDERPASAVIDLLVIHNISLPPGEYGGDDIARLFTNTLDHSAHPFYDTLKGLRVSSHFLIRRDGEVLQFVPCGRRAWHAGVSAWQGRSQCNDFSIGIELEGSDHDAFTDAQYRTLGLLVRALRSAYPIRAAAGHSDIAPDRKTDPGPAFDWTRFLAAAGLETQA